jgi:hypothetical protein
MFDLKRINYLIYDLQVKGQGHYLNLGQRSEFWSDFLHFPHFSPIIWQKKLAIISFIDLFICALIRENYSMHDL